MYDEALRRGMMMRREESVRVRKEYDEREVK